MSFWDVVAAPTRTVAGVFGDSRAPENFVGEQYKDFMDSGRNKYQEQGYEQPNTQYGGMYGTDGLSQAGMDEAFNNPNANRAQNFAYGEFQGNRGPQSIENQDLANREAGARGLDQSGAIQLAREAAMGLAPSQAAYQMQSGLDQSLAAQQAQMGGARSNAGVAMAGGNASANSAALQNQTYNQAAAMRAGEMAGARGQYGGLSGQQREQDLQRLQIGNQNSQFNVGANDAWRLGMGNMAQGFDKNRLGWYGAAQHPYDVQGQMDMTGATNANDTYNQGANRKAGVMQANAGQRAGQSDRLWNFGATGAGIAGSVMGGGGKPPPT